MALLSSTAPYFRVQTERRRIIAARVSIVLIGFAILAVALGIGPPVDPTIFPAP